MARKPKPCPASDVQPFCEEPEGSDDNTKTEIRLNLISHHSETRAPASESFKFDDAFKIGNLIGHRALRTLGLNLLQHFAGSVEYNVPQILLRGWTLLYAASDISVIRALGGENEAPIGSLSYVYHLMDLGEAGPCHMDWQSNFALLRSSVDERLWAVHWTVNSSNEWVIGAVYVPHPALDWRFNSRVFGGRMQSSC